MLRELLNELVTLARKSREPRVLRVDGEPSHVYWIVDADGTLSGKHYTTAPPRRYSLYTLHDLAGAIRRYIGQSSGPVEDQVLVFCGRGDVTVSLQETGERREWLRLELPLSTEYRTLLGLEANRTELDQAKLLRTLRVDLAGAVQPTDVARFRSLKFSVSSESKREISNVRDTLGKAVAAEALAGGAPPPDELTLNVACYRDLSHRVPVRVAVDTDFGSQTFLIVPLAGELARAQQTIDATIRAELETLLDGTNVQVLCGSPS